MSKDILFAASQQLKRECGEQLVVIYKPLCGMVSEDDAKRSMVPSKLSTICWQGSMSDKVEWLQEAE